MSILAEATGDRVEAVDDLLRSDEMAVRTVFRQRKAADDTELVP